MTTRRADAEIQAAQGTQPTIICPSCDRAHDSGSACIIGPVIVCGGRNYQDIQRVYRVLDTVAARIRILAIRQGGCRGADQLAQRWARARCIPIETFSAEWARLGKAAGPVRNQAMLTAHNPAIPTSRVCFVVAFPGGSGTADMVRRARRTTLDVWVVPP